MLIIRTGRGRVSVLRSCQPIRRFLFLDHVKTVGSFVSKKGKIPLIWDDMLRNMPQSDIQERFRQLILNENLKLVFQLLLYCFLIIRVLLVGWPEKSQFIDFKSIN